MCIRDSYKTEERLMATKQKQTESNDDEESHFDNFLSKVENTLNTELRQNELNLLKHKLFGATPMFNFAGPEDDASALKMPFGFTSSPKPNPLQSLALGNQDTIGSRWQDPTPNFLVEEPNYAEQAFMGESHRNISLDQKMVFLLEKLQTLESMLSNTRQELLKLELSIDGDAKQSAQVKETYPCGNFGLADPIVKAEYDRLSDELSILDSKRQGKHEIDSASVPRLTQMYEDFFNYS
eukprot:TRINITY_DN1453_c0_g2_i2.p1 TRINITY_DN1453_c0_g2~~TRINITY_DN1453_c0_g2_i2.p1  ORF type:complete len:238 (-),score=79.16 TRINITY_DN1453_c0_g2_i2:191-904(-)